MQSDPIDGTPLYWNAHPDGIPVRSGDAPTFIDKNALEHAGIKLFARSKVFKIPEDLDEYVKIVDWIANGGGVLRFEKEQAVGEGKWVVWLTWLDIRGYIPSDPSKASINNVMR